MSFETVVWVLNHSPAKGSERLVLLSLASHQNGRWARPAVERIADEAALDRRSVFRALARLESAGQVVVEHRGSKGRGAVNLYLVPTERVAECHQYCCGRVTSDPGRVTSDAQKGDPVPPEPLRAAKSSTARVAYSHPSKDQPEPTGPAYEEVRRCQRCGRLTFDCYCDEP